MFHWTNARTLSLLATGEARITALYNSAYERMVRTYGPANGVAHARALELTTFALVQREEALFEANVERMLATLGIVADPEQGIEDLKPYVYDCDGCGKYVRTADDGSKLPIVLCVECNHGTAYPSDCEFVPDREPKAQTGLFASA